MSTMTRGGGMTVYDGPPTWEPIETLRAYKFQTARMFLVGRCLPGNHAIGIKQENRMAVAWLQPSLEGSHLTDYSSDQWTHDEAGLESLGWEPLYMAPPPCRPPWPPSDHPDVVTILGGTTTEDSA